MASTSEISLVVTDLDGTLWDRDEVIHDLTLHALRQLDARDVPVLVATGRRLRSARRRLHADDLHLPIVALDGAVGRDGDRTFHHRTFAVDDALWLLDAFAEAGISPCVYIDDTDIDVVVDSSPSTHPEHLRMLDDFSATADVDRTVRHRGVHAVGVYGVNGRAGQNLAALTARLRERFAVQGGPDTYLGGYSLMVYPAGTTKWSGVRAYCADRGLDERRVLALGDGPNDLALLAGASVACVVSDGCEDALALADHVIHPASHGGWATVLDLV